MTFVSTVHVVQLYRTWYNCMARSTTVLYVIRWIKPCDTFGGRSIFRLHQSADFQIASKLDFFHFQRLPCLCSLIWNKRTCFLREWEFGCWIGHLWWDAFPIASSGMLEKWAVNESESHSTILWLLRWRGKYTAKPNPACFRAHWQLVGS